MSDLLELQAAVSCRRPPSLTHPRSILILFVWLSQTKQTEEITIIEPYQHTYISVVLTYDAYTV